MYSAQVRQNGLPSRSSSVVLHPEFGHRIFFCLIFSSHPGNEEGGYDVNIATRRMSRSARTFRTPARQDRTIVGQHARVVDGPNEG